MDRLNFLNDVGVGYLALIVLHLPYPEEKASELDLLHRLVRFAGRSVCA
ncbi:MAG: hypothetical protein CM1200mP30_01970 [Pseudomonadota bacterium]|nr:MAG: hypothetical protein CM1200mP30_01970 [Pseudomonadota bacterium]